MTNQGDVPFEMRFRPHKYQMEIIKNLKKKNLVECHRSFGKTYLGIGLLVAAAMRCPYPNGKFFYMAPEAEQADDVAWKTLFQMTENIPLVHHVKSKSVVELPTGVTINICGLKNYDSLRGQRIDGMIIDEFGTLANAEDAWNNVLKATLLFPKVEDKYHREGWVVFAGTPPRDEKHYYYKLYDMIKDSPDWYVTKFDVRNTGLLTASQMDMYRQDMSETDFKREMYCEHFRGSEHSFFYQAILDAQAVGNVGDFAYNSFKPVITGWDIGLDGTAIWFAQISNGRIHLIDYHEEIETGKDVRDFIRILRSKPYMYSKHYLPHDAVKTSTVNTKDSFASILKQAYPGMVSLVKREDLKDSLLKALNRFYLCSFDKNKTRVGLGHLTSYIPKVTSRVKSRGDDHCADAFRYLINQLNPDKEETVLGNMGFRPTRQSSAIDNLPTF